jgi:predicted O-linked N-acetylglucosamine transferase (SPINDLY family)
MTATRLEHALERANTAIAANDMMAAASALSEARLLAPEHPGVRRAYVQVHANLSAQKLKAGDALAARHAAETALAIDAQHMDALINAAAACVDLGDAQAALALYERALALAPYDAKLKALRAHARLRRAGELALENDTVSAMQCAVQDVGTAHSLRTLSLPYVYRDLAHLNATRISYQTALHALEHAPAPLRLQDLVHQNFLLAYQGLNDTALQARFGAWLCRQSQRFQPKLAITVRRRVGLLSSFWRLCTVGSYFASWVMALKQAGFDVELYQLGPQQDQFSAELIAQAGQGAVLNGSLEQIAETLAGRGLDLLIYPELGMDGRTLVLASLQLARQQLCAWGHPVTSGLPSIAHFLSCAEMEPQTATAHYSEHVIALPGLGTRYVKPPMPEPKSAAELGLPLGARVLIAQSPFKLLPQNDMRLVALAHAAPTAQFVLFEGGYIGVNRALQVRLRECFKHHELNPARLHWQPGSTRERFLQIVQACDVALDSYAFSGGNTSLDALMMGLPLVTTEGEFMRGRQSTAMLRALGVAANVATEETLAATAASYLLQRALRKPYRAALNARLDDYLLDYAPLAALVEVIAELCEKY